MVKRKTKLGFDGLPDGDTVEYLKKNTTDIGELLKESGTVLENLFKKSEDEMQKPKLIEITTGLMTVDQLSEYLAIPKSTVYSLSMKAKIPHSHIGKLLRFRKDDIDLWLSEGGCAGKGFES